MTKGKVILNWILRFIVLMILFNVFYFAGAMALNGKLPDTKPEPGLVPANTGVLIIGIVIE